MNDLLQPPGDSAEHVDVRHVDGRDLIADRFEVVRLLGDGSFAVVYEAIDRDLGRRVALKLFTSYVKDELESALREARAMARLSHENVLAVHDIGEHRGTPFLAIEYAEMDLRRWLTTGASDLERVMHLFREAGRGLEAAHRAGLVHHDFKPANVLLRANGTVAVGDFGLARHLDTCDGDGDGDGRGQGDGDGDGQRHTVGTLRYIAPERLQGLAGDERSDQFSYCAALWEALAGAHPFRGADARRRLASITAGPSGAPQAPTRVVRALRRGLSLDPYDRFETMTDLLAALAQPKRSRAARWLRHGARPLLTTAMLAAVFVLGVGLSREAPALDVSVTPASVLTANATMEAARNATFDGDYAKALMLVMNGMPVIRETDRTHQTQYLAQLEVLGDLLNESGAFSQATMVYAAGINLSTDLSADPAVITAKRSAAQANSRRVVQTTDDK